MSIIFQLILEKNQTGHTRCSPFKNTVECEDGNEGRVDGMVVCDLQGWLVPNDKAEVFEPIWESDKVDDRWTDFFRFATWNNRSGLQIAFET